MFCCLVLTPLALRQAAGVQQRTYAPLQHRTGARHTQLRTSCLAASASSDADAASAAIEAIWRLPLTCDPDAHSAWISSDGTVSVLWGEREWERHTSSSRYFRAMLSLPQSTILRGLAPSLAVLGLWSSLVWRLHLTFTTGALGYLASPLGLLLAFRVNAAGAPAPSPNPALPGTPSHTSPTQSLPIPSSALVSLLTLGTSGSAAAAGMPMGMPGSWPTQDASPYHEPRPLLQTQPQP